MSGFCALGYEVLWTRILSIVIGASVYGFTILLMAFLTGIGLGSAAYGLLVQVLSHFREETKTYPVTSIRAFGLIHVMIGVSALVVTLHIRDLPTHAISLYDSLDSIKLTVGLFGTRQLANFIFAFCFMFVPAFFMGVAFPLAGRIHAQYTKVVSHAVGEVLSYNTIGAILGSAVTGFALIYLVGIQRALQILILINLGIGLFVMISVWRKKKLNWAVAGTLGAAILILVLNTNAWKLWDTKYYAIYQSNRPEMFSTPEKIQETLGSNNVLYYKEGVKAIVSSIQAADTQFFITNGRVEASNTNEAMQYQHTLGHLPVLLHKNPRKVFVLGTGSGMTLGATSVHPSVERIVLAEIEPKVLGVAKTFGVYNHYVLDNPKLNIVFNDGRNYLMTTKEKFDVITADPIHPWFSGAGYLYSTDYFRLAAEHLNLGGIACQWLPIYELTNDDLKSVVKTFRENFTYTMVWLTQDDAELVGSNSPIIIDEADLERRITVPQVLQDLKRVKMGLAEDFLSYFVMGNEGSKAYSSGGKLNTDDNVYLEFSAPMNIGKAYLTGSNVSSIVRYRESILTYLLVSAVESSRASQKKKWEENKKAADLYDKAHALYLSGNYETPEYETLAKELNAGYPKYAPWRFLKDEKPIALEGLQPVLLRQVQLNLINEEGRLLSFSFLPLCCSSSKD